MRDREGEPDFTSRTYAVAAHQIFGNDLWRPPTGAYNAELVVPLPPAMQAKLGRHAPWTLRASPV